MRLKHISVKNYPYFVTTRLSNNLKIFAEEKNAQILQATLYFGREKEWCLLLSFVIMPDHLHLILVPRKKNISSIMKSIKGYTGRKINENLNRKGSLWQENFYDYILDSEEKLIAKARYIEENPARRGLASKAEDYKFFSAYFTNLTDLGLYLGGSGTRKSRLSTLG